MRVGILLTSLLVVPLLAVAQSPKSLKLKKISTPVVVDGVIDPVWAEADSATDFFELQPYYGKTPDRRTVAKVLTTTEALYCLIVGYDQRANIQKTTGKLDDFGGDIVSIMLDTFGDKKTAYKLAVTASGVRADCRMLDDARNRDYGWDGVWFSDAKIYDWGYVIEMEIPYRSIQYDEKLDSWGLDFDRWIPSLNEDLYWCEYKEGEGQRISKFGTLVFEDFKPTIKGSNLEIYPVGISKASYLPSSKYKVKPDAGLDIFYNPSPKLTFQLTANPDFAQIEADPFEFNISRYETYYDERRPFFTQGNEIFMPSGRERNTGFYRPLELFYPRRIGKKLPDGSEVPLYLGTKAFGRLSEWEYGGFLAMTGEKDYEDGGVRKTEPRAYFGSVRLKRQFLDNSTIGLLFVGKHTDLNDDGVLDIDGAFRTTNWQLSYQIARSFKNNSGDFGGSAGFVAFKDTWATLIRSRYIGENFDIDEVGFVPWRGTAEFTGLTGPRWYFDDGYIRSILVLAGSALNYEKVDGYTDQNAVLVFNMQFRTNWGYEFDITAGRSKDVGIKYDSYEIDYSSWFNPSPVFNGNLWGGYAKTYNFSRGYQGYYGWVGLSLNYYLLKTMQIGTSGNSFVEWKPDHSVEDVTLNARPYVSLTPVNDLNIRVYVDGLYARSTGKLEQSIFGLLFSYNFLPKSWIYFAVNEVRDRSLEYDSLGTPLPVRLHVVGRAGVLKIKYLYYF